MDASGNINRALVIEDQDLMRLALIRAVNSASKRNLVQGAATLQVALDLTRDQSFDLVVTDPGLPGINPISAKERLAVVEQVIRSAPEARHVVITGSATKEEEEACRALGVTAYLSKMGLDQGAISAILQTAVDGEGVIEVDDAPTSTVPEYYYSDLTQREQDIIQQMLERPEGTRKKTVIEQMAAQLNIDEDTVRKYYKSARAKLIAAGLLPEGL